MTRTQRLSIGIVVGALIEVTGCGNGFELLDGSRQSAIVNGQSDTGHPAVGLLNLGNALCTGTLVGSKTVLTAAHCVTGGAATFKVGGATYPVASMNAHPSYSPQVLSANDVGIVVLAQAVGGIAPVRLAKTAPQVGEAVTIVGFGITGSGYINAGTKRVTTNTVSAVKAQYFSFSGAGGSKGNTCSGDSGGPTFRAEGGVDTLLGVHSTASQPCGYEGNDMRVDQFLSWIEATAGSDLAGSEPTDTKPPTVTLSEPAAAATVTPSFSVKAAASDDDSGLAMITLTVDGKPQGTRTASPALFDLSGLSDGPHVLRVDAQDKAGNVGTVQVSVTVSGAPPPPPQTHEPTPPPPTPGAFGATCTSGGECSSGLCAADSVTQTRYCTQQCSDASPCPTDADCVPTGTVSICAASAARGWSAQGDGLVGGCALGGADLAAGAVFWPLALLALAVLRRRQ
jgi:V8-like Glu-specific endopeptidase